MAGFFGRAESAVLTDKERLHRTELLLSRLYRKDVSPKFYAPALRGVKAMVIFSVLGILLFTGTLFYKFNFFIVLREDVLARGSNLEAAIQRRSNLFGNMVNLTLNHAVLEHEVYSYTARMRTEIVQKRGLSPELQERLLAKISEGARATAAGELESILKDLPANGGASIGRLLAVAEQYPDIQSSKTYQQMMVSLVDMEDLVVQRRKEYNDALLLYNTTISKFPWKLLAHWTKFSRIDYFSTATSDLQPLTITSETYQPLLPFQDPAKEGEH